MERVSTDGYDQEMNLDEVPTMGLGGSLNFSQELSADAVYELARVSHEHVDKIQNSVDGYLDHSQIEKMYNLWVQDPEIPIHPGMADFLEENDHWDEEKYARGEA
jgi:TRAP-type uncharacterized transport system substrate-binding protein